MIEEETKEELNLYFDNQVIEEEKKGEIEEEKKERDSLDAFNIIPDVLGQAAGNYRTGTLTDDSPTRVRDDDLTGVPRRLTTTRRSKEQGPEVVNYVSFNQDHTFMAIGTNNGFSINTCTAQKPGSIGVKVRKSVEGGISIVQIVEQSNVIVYVGTGENRQLPTNKIVFWDEQQRNVAAELVVAA